MTQSGSHASYWILVQACSTTTWQIRLLYVQGVMRSPYMGDGGDPVLPRKASSDVYVRPVPETDTGSQVEHTKASG